MFTLLTFEKYKVADKIFLVGGSSVTSSNYFKSCYISLHQSEVMETKRQTNCVKFC